MIYTYEWIKKRDNGDSTDYYMGKQDTQEAIHLFQSLYGMTFMTANYLFTHLHNTLKLRVTNSESQYRSFIALNNDEITTLRLSKHFATKNSMKTAKKRNGKPNVEYHLVIGRIQSEPHKDDIHNDRMFSGVEVMGKDINLSEFNDGNRRKGIIDEILVLLTNGTRPSNTNENKQYRNMNKKLIRLTESDLHRIVRKSVNEILRETIHHKHRSRRMMNEGLIPTSLRKFMRGYYNNDSTCSAALELLMDDSFVEEQGWMRVFHEGHGDGVYSPKESIVAVFDVDDVPEYQEFHLYKFNPKTWIPTDGDG